MTILQKSSLTLLGLTLLAGCGGSSTSTQTQDTSTQNITAHKILITKAVQDNNTNLNVDVRNSFTNYIFDYKTDTPHIQIYIDTDKVESTGYRIWGEEGAGAEYLIEDDYIFKYTGTGKQDWSWEYIGSLNSKTNDGYHAALSLDYFGKDVTSFVIQSVGVSGDWQNIKSNDDRVITKVSKSNIQNGPALPSLGDYSLRLSNGHLLTQDKLNYYFILGSRENIAHEQYYIDTDKDSSTGYTVDLDGIGAEYLVQDEWLWKYDDTKPSSWPWTIVTRVARFGMNIDQYISVPKKDAPFLAGDVKVKNIAYNSDWSIYSQSNVKDYRFIPRYLLDKSGVDINNPLDERTQYTYDNKEHLIKDVTTLDNNSYVNLYTYNTYGKILLKDLNNEDGHSSETNEYNQFGFISTKKEQGVEKRRDFSYQVNAQGHITKIDEYIHAVPYNPAYHYITNIEYDRNGNVITSSRGMMGYQVDKTYKYDDLNRMIYQKIIQGEAGGRVEETTINYKYDEKNNLIKEEINTPYNHLVTKIYDYDENSNLLKVSIDRDGNIQIDQLYTYDQDGNKLTDKNSHFFIWKEI